MPEPTDMDRPVTKRELLEVLDSKLDSKLEDYPTKEYLSKSLEAWAAAIEDRLTKVIAQSANAILEGVRSQIAVIDDKYQDLPPRVKKLEDKVFAPKRRRAR